MNYELLIDSHKSMTNGIGFALTILIIQRGIESDKGVSTCD